MSPRSRSRGSLRSRSLRYESLEVRMVLSVAPLPRIPTEEAAAALFSPPDAPLDPLPDGNLPSITESNDVVFRNDDYDLGRDDDGRLTVTDSFGEKKTVKYDSDDRPYVEAFGGRDYIDVDAEDYPAEDPVPVAGAFLWGGNWEPSDPAMSFDDVMQLQSPTCSFAATLSAVSRSYFNLSSGIVLHRQLSPNNFLFHVRLYQPDASGVYRPRWMEVPFDGRADNTDLQSTDHNEFWTVLYQRAYLQLTSETNANAAFVGQAFRTLTGRTYSYFTPNGTPSTDVQKIASALDIGKPVIATTKDGPLVLDSSGIIKTHAYTVLGVESGSNGIFVTVRNPWAEDTVWTRYDTDHDNYLSAAEDAARRSGLDGRNDGIVRIPWSTFTANFTQVIVGDFRGAPSNRPLSTKLPVFNHPAPTGLAVNQGQLLSQIDVSAASTNGGVIKYELPAGSPGSVSAAGIYSWTPGPNDVGDYSVTVIAQTSVYESRALTFQIHVNLTVPQMGEFVSNLISVTTTGTEQVTLTARNVSTTIGKIDVVEFVKDANNNGQIDFEDNRLLDTNSSTGPYTWTGVLPALTPGTVTLLARAGRFVEGSLFEYVYSDVKRVDLQVGDTTIPPLVVKSGGETIVNTAYPDLANETAAAYDAAGNSAVFFRHLTTGQIYFQRYNPAGAVLGGPIALSGVTSGQTTGASFAVDMTPGGQFAVGYVVSSTDVRVREFNADGSPATAGYSALPSSGTNSVRVAVAMSEPGQISAAIIYGASGARVGRFFRFSNGTLLANVELEPQVPNTPVVSVAAITIGQDARGVSVVGWVANNQAKAQRFDHLGAAIGGRTQLNAVSGTVVNASLDVDIDELGRYVFAWSNFTTDTRYIAARRYLGDGTPVDEREFRVNDAYALNKTEPRVSFRANKLVIAWYQSPDPNWGRMFGQAYEWKNTLRPLGGNFVPSTDWENNQLDRDVALDYQGKNLLTTWYTTFGSQANIRYQRFIGLDVTPGGFGLQATPSLSESLETIPENTAPGSIVGLFQPNDLRQWTFQLVSGAGSADNAAFTILEGRLKTNATIDFETKKHYSIRVRATPQIGVAIEQTFDIATADSLGGDGKVLTDFGLLEHESDLVDGAAGLSDGRYIAFGETHGNFDLPVVARYLSNGSLDPTFGSDGRVAPGYAATNGITGVAERTDGKLILVSYSGGGTANDITVARLNVDGSLDRTFAGDGTSNVDFGVSEVAEAVAIQPDQKILVGGNIGSANPNLYPALLLRYLPDGGLDPSFGTNGKVTWSFGSSLHYIRDVQLDGDKIVIAGHYYNGVEYVVFVARFLSDGSPDSTFDGRGFRTYDVASGGDFAFSVAVLPDHKLAVAGSFGLMQLLPNGSLDPNFAAGGITGTTLGGVTLGFSGFVSVFAQTDGKLVAGGSSPAGPSGYDNIVARFTTAGTLDPTFDGDGIYVKDLGLDDTVRGVALLPEGAVVVVGTSGNGIAGDFSMIRVDLDGPPVAFASAPASANAGSPVEFTLNSRDVSLVDERAGFLYQIDWNGDGATDEIVHALNGTKITHNFGVRGNYAVRLTAVDQDGRASAPMTSNITIGGTFSADIPAAWLPNQTQTFTVTITNTSATTWSAGGANPYRLGYYFSGNSDAAGDWSSDPLRVALPRDLAPGESVPVTITVASPGGPGEYTLRLRMLKQGVAWQTEVHKTTVSVGTLVAAFEPVLPTFWRAGETRTISVTVTNIGTGTWAAGGGNPVRLAGYFSGRTDAAGDWTSEPTRVGLPFDLAPGASASITIPVTSPAGIGPAVLRFRMVREGINWFADVLPATVSVVTGQALSAAYSATIPKFLTANELRTFSVTVTNAGTTPWTAGGANPVHLGAYFSAVNGTVGDALTEPVRIDLPADLAPGASAVMSVTLRVPALDSGATSLRLRMVKEGVTWFQEFSSAGISLITGQALSAAYSASIPNILKAGEQKTFAVTITNTGTTTWPAGGGNPVNLGVYFSAYAGSAGDALSEPTRIALPGDLLPGASVTVNVTARVPAVDSGAASLRLRMVKEGVTWFPELFSTGISVVSGQALSAAYSATVPKLLIANELRTFQVTVTNSGTVAWPAGGANAVHLGAYFSAVNGTSGDALTEPARFDLAGDLAPGASATLTVTVRAPALDSGATSLRFRMVKEGVAWFPELLTSNISLVTGQTLSAAYSATVPKVLIAGEQRTFSVTVTNAGTAVWTAGGANPVNLGVYFSAVNGTSGDSLSEPLRFALPGDVAPGASVTVTVTARVPNVESGATSLRFRMVKEGVAWFPELLKSPISVVNNKPNSAAYLAALPATWRVNEQKTIAVTLKNVGTTTWTTGGTTPVQLAFYFNGRSDNAGDWPAEPVRVALPGNVAPGESVTVNLVVRAPATAGTTTLRVRLVKEGIGWFDELLKQTVTVS